MKSLAVNTKSGFVAHAARFFVAIKELTPMEAVVLPAAFAAVTTAVVSAIASSLLPAPLGSPSVSRMIR